MPACSTKTCCVAAVPPCIPSMTTSRKLRLSDFDDDVLAQVPVGQRRSQGRSRVHQPPRHQVAEHLIAAVGIDVNDAVKALAGEGMSDVVTEIHEDLFTNTDRSGKAHVVLIESVVHRRHHQNEAVGPASSLLGDVFHGPDCPCPRAGGNHAAQWRQPELESPHDPERPALLPAILRDDIGANASDPLLVWNERDQCLSWPT